jgi:predicted nucleic acid-binding Zn ribbon protein
MEIDDTDIQSLDNAYEAPSYQRKSCLACGRGIPRWVKGKQTPAHQQFCSSACGKFYRRMHRSEGRASERKKTPAAQRPLEPVLTTEGRWDIRHCKQCRYGFIAKSPDQRFCTDRCAAYVPLPPRKKNANWYIVTGPIDYCHECWFAITPRKPHGFITPWRNTDGMLSCLECHDLAKRRRTKTLSEETEALMAEAA